MTATVSQDSVRIDINKSEGGDEQLQTTIGSSAANSAQATNFLQDQLGSLSTKSITVLKRQVTYRELIFIAVAAALFITTISLVVVVTLDYDALHYSQDMATCTDYDCYKSASVTQRKLNNSHSPCHNFYRYSCAQWTDSQSLLGNEKERTVLTVLEAENMERLNDAIMAEVDPLRVTDWAYEGKLQKMYKTCLNQYQMTNYFDSNNPLLNEIDALGGWSVFNDDISKFKWTSVHRKNLAHDNLVDVFFYYDVEPWDQQHKTYKLTLRDDWQMPLPWNKWEIIPGYQDYQTPYKKLLANAAMMLATDKGVKDSGLNDRINSFVADVIKVESALAKAISDNKAELTSNRYVLTLLGFLTPIGPVLDGYSWVDYFRTTLEEAASNIGSNTQVIVKTPKTLDAVAFAMRSIKSKEFNSYLVWRLIYSWLGDMSFEYNHLQLNWKATLSGNTGEYKPNWVYCMEQARYLMPDALDAVYVRKHFNNLDKDEITFMSERIRKSVAHEVQNLPWLDEATRQTAADKITAVVEKLGYPDFMYTELSTQNMLDYSYMKVNMSDFDHFQNIQQLRQHYRREITNIFLVGRDPLSDWRETPLYTVRSTYFYPWNEMVVPAGLLEFPIFSGDNPVMYRMQTFGSAGFRLARGYLYAISENGQWFDKSGNQLGTSWWSAATQKQYSDGKQCLTNWYSNVVTDPVVVQGQKQTLHLTYPDVYASQAAIDIGAVRNAYRAYVSHHVQSDPRTASEQYLPGVWANSRSEYFFLAFAQSYCAIRDDEMTYQRMKSSSIWLPEEQMVNNILMNLPEFSQVFSCPAGSKMNPQTGCFVF